MVTDKWTALEPRPMSGPRRTRRACLVGLSLPVASALTGCSTLLPARSESTPTPPSYEHLRRTAVHVDPGVSLDLPDGVQVVESPANADLVVLPAATDVTAATAVDWLAQETVVALLGADAEETWFRWQRSDEYRDTFDRGGSADASPDPELLVAFAVGVEYVSTHRSTWGHTDDPSDAEVLSALEEALADEANRTPPG